MSLPHPFALALSGGGFRATAFHLGVLKRLNELGLLRQVDIISSVSGGSIAAACWVHWQATKGDTLTDPGQWNEFEQSMITLMRNGLRERLIRRGLGIPWILLFATVNLILHFFSGVSSVWSLAGVLFATFVTAYVYWHYISSILLEKAYDSYIFKGHKLADLTYLNKTPDSSRYWPRILINATLLNTGANLVFTAPHTAKGPEWERLWEGIDQKPMNVNIPIFLQEALKDRQPLPMPTDISLARAVAASSAIPGVFTPITMRSPFFRHSLLFPTLAVFRHRFFRIADGGIRDNQGTGVLLDLRCRAVIASDAARTIQPRSLPSSWQLIPVGRGVIFRSQEITYERARQLGYDLLKARHGLYRLLSYSKEPPSSKNAKGPITAESAEDQAYENQALEANIFIELNPRPRFWIPDAQRLPDELIPYVAAIRTDLNRFSAIEVSALMFHGYTVIDHSIRTHQPDWIPQHAPDLNFHSVVKEVDIHGNQLTAEEHILRYHLHLAASDSRSSLARLLRRILYRWRRSG
ncbi:MAG: hypothetical protein OJF52_002897 [Nitrospira sp.]|nr:MAG: hypothetical protein OJF52_002897 [Nitrospira sp.]